VGQGKKICNRQQVFPSAIFLAEPRENGFERKTKCFFETTPGAEF